MNKLAKQIDDRARLLRELRSFFDGRGFREVQPPCIGSDSVVDAYLDPITISATELGLPRDHKPSRYHLQTSPESGMKRMLADGAPSIYSLGPVFRGGEVSPTHNPEFTMLEWYDIDASVDESIDLLGQLAIQSLSLTKARVMTYQEAFTEHAEVDPFDDGVDRLSDRLRIEDSQAANTLQGDRDAILDALLTTCIQPKLVGDVAWIIRDYPFSQAALAKRSRRDFRCAERFELFAKGVELANGYDELLDADELIRRYEFNNRKRVVTGRKPLPIDTKLVSAMRLGLPDCCGVALGVDRLLMVRIGATCLSKVMPLTIDLA